MNVEACFDPDALDLVENIKRTDLPRVGRLSSREEPAGSVRWHARRLGLGHAFPMGYPGSRSKQTETWMLRDDAAHLGSLIAEGFREARWRCSHPGPAHQQPTHLHTSIVQALECGGLQAFLPLPIGSDPFANGASAEIQFVESDVWEDGLGRCLRAGRLATMWIEPDVGPAAHELMSGQRHEVWRILRAATRPAAAEDQSGRPLTGRRIGSAAEAKVIAEGLQLALMGGWARYRLRRTMTDS